MSDFDFQQSRLARRYSPWIDGDSQGGEDERAEFFKSGIIILDTNILLSLYEYTRTSRLEILSALENVSTQLWLPYQVGLEFVNGRRRVLVRQSEELGRARSLTEKRATEVIRTIASHSDQMTSLIGRYSRDTQPQVDLESLREEFKQASEKWKSGILKSLGNLKRAQDISVDGIGKSDPILAKVAELFGDRIADPTGADTVRRRIRDAVDYRFPNRIPPGFSDEGKDTELDQAGDLLIWEEIIEHAASSSSKLVLFVSNDTKEDWYEPAGPGQAARPWPALFEEMRVRAGSRLRIETAAEFFDGIESYLNIPINASTFEEIDQVADEIESFPASADLSVDGGLSKVVAAFHATDPQGDLLESCVRDALAIALSDASGDAASDHRAVSSDGMIASVLTSRNIAQRFEFVGSEFGDFLVEGVPVVFKYTSRRSAIMVNWQMVGAVFLFVRYDRTKNSYSAGLFAAEEHLRGASSLRGALQVHIERIPGVHWLARNRSLH
ncbi:hypothetical protein GCM10010495_14670 [Kitasatospora herbaricolor]|uniref:NaeI family type II restriction endonuclease n=1 Tax=Kitasatospora herbaricolor TaxID=68217 RepID=UPI00174D286F|nr:NaeI family type II restriction endonuclease [Kitasatospora herbaricolor]MDQ0309274.1 hypothetical protein [Kitasatospora herbaricolor]GGV04069.1 hypothetical protein GCM10010495_14670 [Kitasatospora herbaricolor]